MKLVTIINSRIPVTNIYVAPMLHKLCCFNNAHFWHSVHLYSLYKKFFTSKYPLEIK